VNGRVENRSGNQCLYAALTGLSCGTRPVVRYRRVHRWGMGPAMPAMGNPAWSGTPRSALCWAEENETETGPAAREWTVNFVAEELMDTVAVAGSGCGVWKIVETCIMTSVEAPQHYQEMEHRKSENTSMNSQL